MENQVIEVIKCVSILLFIPLFIYPTLFLTIMAEDDPSDKSFSFFWIYLLYIILTIYIWYQLLFIYEEYIFVCIWFILHPALYGVLMMIGFKVKGN